MIRLEHISGGYDKKQVLYDINAEITDGEIISVIGKNGCGKSTLLEIAAGLMKPSDGRVLVDNEDIHAMNSKKRARLISMLSQQKSPGMLTVRALVYHGRFPYLGYPRKYTAKDNEAVEKAMREAGVLSIADESLSELSGGQQQKAYIAMLLAQDTKIVYMDEPVTFLDINYQLELMNIIKEMQKAGKTVIMVMHELSLAMSCSDRIMAIKDGRLLYMGKPRELYENNIFEELFGIEACYSQEAEQYFFKKGF